LALPERLARHGAGRIVLEPVLVATSGDRLLDADAVEVIRRRLVPIAEVVTPNLAEAAVLLDEGAADSAPAMRRAAERLHRLAPRAVLLKGGHLPGDRCPDPLFDGERMIELSAARVATSNMARAAPSRPPSPLAWRRATTSPPPAAPLNPISPRQSRRATGSPSAAAMAR
jgi:hydroxymethylpyrimidine/phosphomethylpyrimidine kinase